MFSILMLLIIFLSAYLQQTNSKPLESVNIIQHDGLGKSLFRYETTDGTLREETVEVVNKNTENETVVISGFYSYLDPQGIKYYVNYIADEKGFRPQIFVGEIELEPHISSAAVATLQGGGIG